MPHVPWVDVPAGGDARGWLAAVDDLLGRLPPDAILVPGHDHVSDVATLREFRKLLAEAIDVVEAGIREGGTREEVAAVGLSDRWDDWEGVIPISRFLETVHESLADTGVDLWSAFDADASVDAVAFTGGLWWNGAGFAPDTMFARAESRSPTPRA